MKGIKKRFILSAWAVVLFAAAAIPAAFAQTSDIKRLRMFCYLKLKPLRKAIWPH